MNDCAECKNYYKIKPKKNKEIITKKDEAIEVINQIAGQVYYGCMAGNEKHHDYITGITTRILTDCRDRNKDGKCNSFIKRKLLWII
jgi:hypothetical protein